MAHSAISIAGVFLLVVLQEVQCMEYERDNSKIRSDIRDKVLYNPSHPERNSELIPTTIDIKYNGDGLATKGSLRVKRQDPYYNPYYNRRYRYPYYYPIPIFIGGGFGIGGLGGFGGRGFGGRGFGGRGFGGRGFGGRGIGGRGGGFGGGFGGRGGGGGGGRG